MRAKILLTLMVLAGPTHGQLINDESYFDSGFLKFKSELQVCVTYKDTAGLRKLLADRIYESKDGCGDCTKDAFMEYLFGESAAESSWNSMQKILRFGFSRIEDRYPNSIVPHDKIIFHGPSYLKTVDTDNELIILGEKINIREKPSLKSRIIRQASFEKFKCDCNVLTMTSTTYQKADGVNWIEIKLSDGKVGYVVSEYTSSELIKEMTVAKINGEWKIISFSNPPGC